MLTLLLLRHAKAQAHGPTDFERELSTRGRVQARAVGEGLHGRGILPDLVLCSASVRTRQTWSEVRDQLQGHEPEVRFLEELYSAGPGTIRGLLAAAPSGGTVLVVGHEPIMSMTAAQYAGADSDLTALMGVRSGMPTAAYALIELPEPSAATGNLRELVRSTQ